MPNGTRSRYFANIAACGIVTELSALIKLLQMVLGPSGTE